MKAPLALCSLALLGACLTIHTGGSEKPRSAGGGADDAAGEDPKGTMSFLVSVPEMLDDDVSGFLLGSPTGFTVTDKSDGEIQVVSAGFDPGTNPGPTAVDFAEFTRRYFSDLQTEQAPVLAMSLGIDVMSITVQPIDGGAETVAVAGAGTHGWMAFQFSVDTVADPEGELAPDIAAAADAGELDCTVFSYLVPGSDAEMLPFEWQSVKAMEPAKLGLSAGDTIDALNMHMALYGTDLVKYHDKFTVHPLPTEPFLYFTLRPEFLAELLPTEVEEMQWLTPSPNSGIIYRSRWSGGAWQEPQKFLSPADLGFDPKAKPPVLDGLAISTFTPGILAEVLFSRDESVPVDQQLTYVRIEEGSPPEQRRVVVEPTPGTFESLATSLGGGRGIGDFCTKDPVAEWSREWSPESLIPDDFFVARRLPPPVLYAHPALFPPGPLAGRRFTLIGYPTGLFDPQGAGRPLAWPPEAVPGWRVPPRPLRAFTPQVMAFDPELGIVIPVPELGLAVASYRQSSPHPEAPDEMFTCMSWPRPTASTGKATVRFGTMDLRDYFSDPDAVEITWLASRSMEYEGRPLTSSRPLPDDGVLVAGTTEAMVAYWVLHAGGKTYVSPLSALRY